MVHTPREILTPDILAEEAMLIQFRIDVLQADYEKTDRYALRMVILDQIDVNKRLLRTIHTLWNDYHQEYLYQQGESHE